MEKKREPEIIVISDVHLGTIGCHAKELNLYLKSVKPKILILNGDILDMWQFKKYYFPESHMKILKRVLSLLSKGTTVYYLTGNHDESLRRFSDFSLGNFHLKDKLLLNLDGKKAWFFHGDIFDITMKYSKWVAKLGSIGYSLLILLNRFVNFISVRMGRGKLSISKRIKDSVKTAVKFTSDFEMTSIDLAIDNGYDYVVCGHIHRPNITDFSNEKGNVTYLNSGDWIENLTALEYENGEWNMFKFEEADLKDTPSFDKDELIIEQNGIPNVDMYNTVLEHIFVSKK